MCIYTYKNKTGQNSKIQTKTGPTIINDQTFGLKICKWWKRMAWNCEHDEKKHEIKIGEISEKQGLTIEKAKNKSHMSQMVTLSDVTGWTGGASDIVKAKSSGEDPRATGGLVCNLPHPRVNKTKQHWYQLVYVYVFQEMVQDESNPEQHNRIWPLVRGWSQTYFMAQPGMRANWATKVAMTCMGRAWEIKKMENKTKKPQKKIRNLQNNWENRVWKYKNRKKPDRNKKVTENMGTIVMVSEKKWTENLKMVEKCGLKFWEW